MAWPVATHVVGDGLPAGDWNDAANDINALEASAVLVATAGGSTGNPSLPLQVQMQTGSAVITAAAGATTITFPQAFPNGCAIVLVCSGDDDSGNTVNLHNASTTTSGFAVKIYAAAVQVTTGNFRVNYIAIGW